MPDAPWNVQLAVTNAGPVGTRRQLSRTGPDRSSADSSKTRANTGT
jgi:hypothetical protein